MVCIPGSTLVVRLECSRDGTSGAVGLFRSSCLVARQIRSRVPGSGSRVLCGIDWRNPPRGGTTPPLGYPTDSTNGDVASARYEVWNWRQCRDLGCLGPDEGSHWSW